MDHDIVAVGEILVDLVAPDADDLQSAHTFHRLAGGAPANVAVAAARLGARAALVSAVGQDPFGGVLRATLTDNGVDASTVVTVPERTTLALVARNQGGIPDFVFYRGADRALAPEHLPREAIAHASIVHLSSMALLSEPSRSATLGAAEMAQVGDALVSVDPNLRPSSWPSIEAARDGIAPLLAAADILKVNDEEARLFTGEHALDRALAVLGRPEALAVVTLGAEGCLWRWMGRTGQVPAPPAEVADTTGAGDAFVGALLAELCRHGYGRRGALSRLSVDTLEALVRFACAAGTFSCQRPGAMASLPTRDEVERLLNTARGT